METKLIRIAELAKSDPRMKFTSIAHLLNKQSLVQCHLELLSSETENKQKETPRQTKGN